MASILIEHDDFDTEQDLMNALEAALSGEKDSAIGPEQLTIHRTYRHPDWEHGDPCPECGNPELSVINTNDEIHHSEDGDFVYVDQGEPGGMTMSIMCQECNEELYHTPYDKL